MLSKEASIAVMLYLYLYSRKYMVESLARLLTVLNSVIMVSITLARDAEICPHWIFPNHLWH
jgi:hypothetical protein